MQERQLVALGKKKCYLLVRMLYSLRVGRANEVDETHNGGVNWYPTVKLFSLLCVRLLLNCVAMENIVL